MKTFCITKDLFMDDILKCGPKNCMGCKNHGFIGSIYMGYCKKCCEDYNGEKGPGHLYGYELEICSCVKNKWSKQNISQYNEHTKNIFFEYNIPKVACELCTPYESQYFQEYTDFLHVNVQPCISDIKTIKSKQTFRNIARKYIFASHFVSDMKSLNLLKEILRQFLAANQSHKKHYPNLFQLGLDEQIFK